MSTWKKQINFGFKNNETKEKWISNTDRQDSYEVDVRYGKEIDICSLKFPIICDLEAQINEHRISRKKLFDSEKVRIFHCPICNAEPEKWERKLNIYGAEYYHCTICDHYFLKETPAQSVLEDFYKYSKPYSNIYVDKKTLETRLNQVAVPKLEWVIKQFSRQYGRKPESILDVGAGGGHFVYVCKQNGLNAQGIELSESSLDFCRENFNFDLICKDFLKEKNKFDNFDIVTFWGIIEHVPNPNDFLKSAFEILNGRDSMIVASVPRWDCFDTAIQKSFPDSIIRHLDPMGHIHCFSDSSLASAFEMNGFAPCSAWYFGMDVYELMIQLSYHLHDDQIIDLLKPHLITLQNAIDQGCLSDEIVLAGIPKKGRNLT
jgi:2-polyprenyl-3-methyl-5-hydroxy-6-metoxy-1,4-benzoquinol methylase